MGWFVLFAILFLAVMFLRGFDRIAGRGPKQISDGITDARTAGGRVSCPECAEMILPAAKKCPFCKSSIR